MLAAGSISIASPVSDQELASLWREADLPQMQLIAERGDLRAQYWMGLMLHNRGRFDEAIRWYTRAVDQGDGKSANRIAFFYEGGIGRPKDLKAAMDWHRKGATLGDFSSQIQYAYGLRSGTGLVRNEREAFRWYAKAATQHDYEQAGYAYLPVAEMYEEGTAVPRDLRRAYAFAKAAEPTLDDSDIQGQAKARALQARAATRLQPEDLRAAEQIFKELRPDLARRSVIWPGVLFLTAAFALTGLVIMFRRRAR
jgi:tetratricopeptide (TPR) repeat protein